MKRFTKLALAAAVAFAASQALAAGVAVYEVRVERTWSESTHPRDYPGDVAHFSPGIGAAHAPAYRMFAQGAMGGVVVLARMRLEDQGHRNVVALAGGLDPGTVGIDRQAQGLEHHRHDQVQVGLDRAHGADLEDAGELEAVLGVVGLDAHGRHYGGAGRAPQARPAAMG